MTLLKVSILIPCHNAEQWVGAAIRSALAQTWANKEVIVVDDGSTDESLNVIRAFGDAIRLETGPNRGGNMARNRLLELATGEWLQYLDADDYLLPEKIECQLGELNDPLAADVAYSPVIMEYCEGKLARQEALEIPAPHDPWSELVRWQLPQTGAALWRRSAVVEIGAWRPDQPCCQEHELYLRLLSAKKSFQFCPTPGAVYRQWSTATVCRRNPLQTITRRLRIVDSAERHLEQTHDMNAARRNAVAHARLECARSLYPLDRAESLRIAAKARREHPTHRLSAMPCFPRAYRWVYQVAGFHVAEIVAGIMRPLRKNRMA